MPLSVGIGSGVGLAGGGGVPFAYFGVNISGPEFPPANANYAFPSDTDWNYLRSKGVKLVRLPIAWERLQASPGVSSLDSTYMGLITTALSKAAARGMQVIVDLHNFARWATNYSTDGYPGQSGYVLGSANLTQAMFVDVWQKLATALVGRAGLAGYDLMNEPHDMVGTNLITTPNYFTGPNWFVTNGAARTRLAEGTNPLGSAYGAAWASSSGTGFGSVAFPVTFTAVPYVLSLYAKVPSGTNSNFYLQIAGTNSAAKTLTSSWQRFEFSRTPAAGASNIQFGLLGVATADVPFHVANVQLELASTATTYVPNPWTPFAQAVVTAVRAIDTTTPIYVGGYQYSSAKNWNQYNYELAVTGSSIRYEAHQYFDNDGSGIYDASYAGEGATAATGSDALVDFAAWLTANGFTGYLGEFGVPNDDSQWVTLLDNFLIAAKAANIPGSAWFYGAFSAQDSGRLNLAKSANGNADAPQIATLVRLKA